MAFSAADLDILDQAIKGGVLEVRFADGRLVRYQALADLLRAREFVQQQIGSGSDPAQQPGGVTYAEWGGGW